MPLPVCVFSIPLKIPLLTNQTITMTAIQSNPTVIIWGNTDANPIFVTGLLGGYYLSHTAAGQEATSPCVNAGSDTAANLGFDRLTTRSDGAWDTGVVDLGFHYKRDIADLYYDGIIDINDLLIMAQQWLDVPGEPSADLAPEALDNFIDYRDFAVIYQYWLWQQ